MQARNRLGQYIGGMRFARKAQVVSLMFCGAMIFGGMVWEKVGPMLNNEFVYIAAPRAEAAEVPKPTKANVMERVCKAESGCRQFYDTGKVVVHVNDNGSHDIGKYQINFEVWGMRAMSMGYNLYTEEGNEGFAYWLFDNYGTEPWYSSKPNWK